MIASLQEGAITWTHTEGEKQRNGEVLEAIFYVGVNKVHMRARMRYRGKKQILTRKQFKGPGNS